jgi:aspartyl-tRNA(Asn)/glutamyl-tRNA(Gln) amidotransferase subunit B
VSRAANELAAGIDTLSNLTTDAFTQTVLMEAKGELSATQSKVILGELLANGGDPKDIAAEKGFEQMSSDSLGATIDDIISKNPDEWQRYKDGDDKLSQFFVGQAMKMTQGKANGKAVIAELQLRK